MFSLTQINKLIYGKFHATIHSIHENTEGYDQFVWIITLDNENLQKIVLKQPKNDSAFRITREVIACQELPKVNVQCPKVLFWNKDYLIETFIPGKMLNDSRLSASEKCKIFTRLGILLKKIHSIHAEGFGLIKTNTIRGEFLQFRKYSNNEFYNEIENLRKTNLFTTEQVEAIQDYYQKQKNRIDDNLSVLLHADFADSNIILLDDHKLTIIDFTDLSTGHPMQDFSYMYEKYFESEFFDAFCRGYGDVDLQQVEFFTFCRFLWLIPMKWREDPNSSRLNRIIQLFKAMWIS